MQCRIGPDRPWALDRAARHPFALAVELGLDLVGLIDLEVLFVDPNDFGLELLVKEVP